MKKSSKFIEDPMSAVGYIRVASKKSPEACWEALKDVLAIHGRETLVRASIKMKILIELRELKKLLSRES